jgi:hypothetical protein
MRLLACTAVLLMLAACVENPAGVTTPGTVVVNERSFSIARGAVSGNKQKIDSAGSLNPDCTSQGIPTIRIVRPPVNGRLTVEQGEDYLNFSKDNPRSQCSTRKSPVMMVYYVSNPGYVGPDVATIEIIYTGGTLRTVQYNINVL